MTTFEIKCRELLLGFFIDEYVLLPLARCLVCPVDAAHPAARSTLTVEQLLERSSDASFARFLLLGAFDPAEKFIASEWSNVAPQRQCLWIAHECRAEIGWSLMDCAGGDVWHVHRPILHVFLNNIYAQRVVL